MNTVKAKLESIYGVERISAVNSYRGVYLIPNLNGVSDDAMAENRAWVLKQLKVGAVKAYLIGKLLAEKILRPITPAPIQPDEGSYYLWIGGNRYHLTHYLEGVEADYYRIIDLQAAIRSMALFHRLTSQLINCNESAWSIIRYDIGREWKQRLTELEICRVRASRECDAQWDHSHPNDLAKKYLQIWPECYNQALQAFTELMNSDYECGAPRSICYHDWARHNLIIHEGIAFLIDFDYMIIDHPVHDRANLMGHYLRLRQWSLHSLNTILENFDRDYPLRSGELNLLRLLLLFPSDYWILGRQYFIEKQPWSLKYYQDQWDRKISLYQQRNRLLTFMESL
jgi:CotS family spore coat protein